MRLKGARMEVSRSTFAPAMCINEPSRSNGAPFACIDEPARAKRCVFEENRWRCDVNVRSFEHGAWFSEVQRERTVNGRNEFLGVIAMADRHQRPLSPRPSG